MWLSVSLLGPRPRWRPGAPGLWTSLSPARLTSPAPGPLDRPPKVESPQTPSNPWKSGPLAFQGSQMDLLQEQGGECCFSSRDFHGESTPARDMLVPTPRRRRTSQASLRIPEIRTLAGPWPPAPPGLGEGGSPGEAAITCDDLGLSPTGLGPPCRAGCQGAHCQSAGAGDTPRTTVGEG